MPIDALGWLRGTTQISSPNCGDEMRPDATLELIVIHAISLPPREFGGDDVTNLFMNCLAPEAHPYFMQIAHLRVSSHFFIRRDGEIIQFVPTLRSAWHAGVSSWRGRERCNDFSIGIELEGCDELPFADAQYDGLTHLLDALTARHPTLVDVAGHADIAPGRKTDPGAMFDWTRVPARLTAWRRQQVALVSVPTAPP